MNKKLTATGLAVVMGVNLIASSAFAMMPTEEHMVELEIFANYELEKPEDWMSYSREDKKQFFEDNNINFDVEYEKWKGGKTWQDPTDDYDKVNKRAEELLEKAGVEKPAEWDTLTIEQKKAYLIANDVEFSWDKHHKLDDRRENAHDHLMDVLEEKGITVPENWTDMTREEKKSFLEENGIDFDREDLKDKIKNNKHSKKGERFKKLEKLAEKVQDFMDKNEITRAEAVAYLQERGVINGYGDGSFKPKNGISRAEAIKIVLEAIGEEPTEVEESEFSDVEKGAWYKGYIQKAKDRGYVKGYDDGTFKPNQTVNKVELMKIAFEIMGLDVTAYEVATLPEDADENAWYVHYLSYAVDTGLIDLDEEGNARPGQSMTREEFSEFVYRLILQQESL